MFCLVKIYSTGHLDTKQKMIRIFKSQLLKVSVFPQTKCDIVRNIWTSSRIHYSKFTAQEIADRKRKDEEMRWTKFYHYPNMKYHAIVTRLKIYPTLATLFFTPTSLILEAQQIIPPNTFLACLGCGKNMFNYCHNFRFTKQLKKNLLFHYFQGVTGIVTLSTYSAILANTIGLIYICKENKNLQIGYIDFMGRQKFVETTVEELRKCEKSPAKFGVLGRHKTIKVRDGNEDKELKILWNVGDIYDIKLFRSVFGK